VPRKVTPGGMWTPAAALGLRVLPRLQERAGLSFEGEGGAAQAKFSRFSRFSRCLGFVGPAPPPLRRARRARSG
jgi:hypothetical protein